MQRRSINIKLNCIPTWMTAVYLCHVHCQWFGTYELYVVTLWSNGVPPLSGKRHTYTDPMWNLVTMWYFGMLWPCDPMVYRPWVVKNTFNVQYPPSPETKPLLIIYSAPQLRISLVTPPWHFRVCFTIFLFWALHRMVYHTWVVRDILGVRIGSCWCLRSSWMVLNGQWSYTHWTWITFVSSFTLPPSPYPAWGNHVQNKRLSAEPSLVLEVNAEWVGASNLLNSLSSILSCVLKY